MQNLSGRTIKTYELRELIGEGGFGAVYRAYQQLIGREVAIKIILPQYANHPNFIRRFETEAQLVARLEHPHIVPLYDYWREPSGAYLVMRWLRGGSLQDKLETDGAWQPRAVSHMLNQICEALVVAHRQNVIHRDLKPENILLDNDGNAYLTDFGIAKDLGGKEKITQNNAILGSPAYLSPEQIKGEPVTPASDIYSLGVLVYELLTASRPFDEASAATLMYKHLSEPLPDLNLIKADIPMSVNAVLQRATAKDPADRFETAIDFAREFRLAVKSDGTDDPFSPTSTAFLTTSTNSIAIPDPDNPYKGLRAFQQADAEDFFGRDVLILSIIKRLQEPVDTNRFLAVVGPSGSGKSSVVKAGVLPELRRGAMPGSDNWFIVEMLPGIDPLEELEAALLRIAINPPESLLEQLSADSRGLIRAVKRVLPDDETELLIFIDQFEEIFTLVDDEGVRRHFLDSLLQVIGDPRSRIRVIITLRADFYDRPLQYSGFGELIRQRTEIVLPLSTDELERAISGPAHRVGLHLEDGLVTAMVTEVKDQPGALPLLQYALTELFERREGLLLSLEAFHEVGGTLGALARRADELYEGLSDEGQEAAHQMFLRLVTLGEGAEDTRRRALQSELLSIGDDSDEIELVIDAFGRYRLLTFDHDPATRSATVEVAHEALIRQWKRLRSWLDASREDVRTQRRLAALTEDWLTSERDPSFLMRGLRLQQLENWFNNTDMALNDSERTFLQASISERDRREAEETARIERERLLEKRSRDRLRALVTVLGVFSIIAVGLALFAFSQQQEAQDARIEAEANEQRSEGLRLAADARNQLIQNNPTLALSLALAADGTNEAAPVEILRVLAETAYAPGIAMRFEGHTGTTLSGDINADGRLTVSASTDGTLRIWDRSRPDAPEVMQIQQPGVVYATAVFSNDTTMVVAGGTGGALHLFDTGTGQLVRSFEGHTDTVTSVQIDSNLGRVLSGSADHSIRLWDLDTGELLQVFEDTPSLVFEVAMSSDGETVVSSHGDRDISAGQPVEDHDRLVRVWDVATGEVRQRIQPNSGWVRTVTISPDDQFVVYGVWDNDAGGTIRIHNIETGEEVRRIFGHSDLLSGIEVSDDGQYIATTSWDRTLRVWDFATGVEVHRFEVFDSAPLDLAWSDDSSYIAVFGGQFGKNDLVEPSVPQEETGVWLIDLENRVQRQVFTGHDEWVWSTAVTPDGRFVASGAGPLNPDGIAVEDRDSTVRIWDATTSEQVALIREHTSTVEAVNFSPDGTNLITGAWDGDVILWGFSADADGVSLSEIWRYQLMDTESSPVKVLNAVFSPDGLQLAVAGQDGTVTLLDAQDGTLLRRFTAHDAEVAGLAFSPDGTRLASGSWDNTAALWETASGERLFTMTGHTNRINDLAFSLDGRYILTGSWDTTMRLWDAATGELIRQYSGHLGFIQTVALNEDATLALSGGADTTMRLWDVQTGQEIYRFDNHNDWVSQALFVPGTDLALSSGQDTTLRLWQLPRSSQTVRQWAAENRYIRDLTCSERDQYLVLPLCDDEGRVE